MHTHVSSTVVFPNDRNVHGKAFGGFVIRSAYDLAYLAARYFTRGKPFVPVGFDDAIFLLPVAIGDMVRFEAQLLALSAQAAGGYRVARLPAAPTTRTTHPDPPPPPPAPAHRQVRFTARVVHSGEDGVFRVFVTMDVIEPTDPDR